MARITPPATADELLPVVMAELRAARTTLQHVGRFASDYLDNIDPTDPEATALAAAAVLAAIALEVDAALTCDAVRQLAVVPRQDERIDSEG